MSEIKVRGVIPYVFCADAGAIADWCVEVLGFVERERWSEDDGVVRNVELIVGDSEVWLDGPVAAGRRRQEVSDPGSDLSSMTLTASTSGSSPLESYSQLPASAITGSEHPADPCQNEVCKRRN